MAACGSYSSSSCSAAAAAAAETAGAGAAETTGAAAVTADAAAVAAADAPADATATADAPEAATAAVTATATATTPAADRGAAEPLPRSFSPAAAAVPRRAGDGKTGCGGALCVPLPPSPQRDRHLLTTAATSRWMSSGVRGRPPAAQFTTAQPWTRAISPAHSRQRRR